MSNEPVPGALLGVVGGLVWFMGVTTASIVQQTALLRGELPWLAAVLVAVVSGLCVLGFRVWGAAWGGGLSFALATCLLLGLIEGPIPPQDAPSAFSIPASFSVGLGSVAVWVALGVSVALCVGRTKSSAGVTRLRERESV